MTRLTIIITVFGLLAMATPVLALQVLDPNYTVETFTTYSEPEIGPPTRMAFDPNGNLYVTQADADSIWRVTPDGLPGIFLSNFNYPRHIIWGGGTSYGDYLYANGPYDTFTVTLDAVVSHFSNMDGRGGLEIDRTGNYGGYMYAVTRGQDHTYRVNTNGTYTMFSNFPGWKDGGGGTDIAFDIAGNYGGLMYMTVHFNNCCGNQPDSGLFSLDTGGNAARFTNDLVATTHIDFDLTGDFDGEMFVIGRAAFDHDWTLWRVATDGTATEFAVTTLSSVRDLIFGPDGAMYVAEHDEPNDMVIISRVYAGPPPLLVGLEITGPDEVAENHQTQYHAIAHYDNNSTRDLTDLALWSVEPSTLAAIDENGLLTTQTINYLTEDITIYAEYTEDNNSVDAEKPVSIVAICPTGTALDYDGADDYVEVEDDSSLDLADGMTISAWVKPDSTLGARTIVSKWNDNTSDHSLIFKIHNHSDKLRIELSKSMHNDLADLTGETSIATGNWLHVATTFDLNTVKLYLNGIQDGSQTTVGTIRTSVTKLLIGASVRKYEGVSEYFDGKIDEVAIYDRALSAEQIQMLMHTRPDTDEPNLVAYWNFDEGEGQIVYDLSSNANHGRLGSDPNAADSDPAWVDSDAPVGICTPQALIERNLYAVLQIKYNFLEQIAEAFLKEDATSYLLEEMLTAGDYGDLNRRSLRAAKNLIDFATQRQHRSRRELLRSVETLEDALLRLGIEPHPNSPLEGSSAPKRQLRILDKPAPAVIRKPPRK